ncbi:hypothetical protein IFR05_001937 [Cadophora sp. M221]|nr:hypothetical protein IFR05_001937 [Cadophora sp. M221]
MWNSLIVLALYARVAVSQNMLRFACSQLSVERLDPIGNPGLEPSTHLHQIAGGNSFNASMNAGAHDTVGLSSCTSCTFSEDFSNYWTAVLYFRARNGTYKRVPQMANQGLTQQGGLTVYYIPPYDGKTKVTAFKPGFRMLVGDPMIRSSSAAPKGVCHRCFGKNQQPFGGAPCTGADTSNLPKGTCLGGIRETIMFPTCWDGKNLDSPDHRTHIAYPSSGTFESGGPCPATHPVKLPQVMFEVMWDTSQFNDKSIWPADGSQPFVYSMGDGTGYGNHGDYLFGWKGDSLQKAMDARCNLDKCAQTPSQSAANSIKCQKSQTVKEPVDGWLTTLPGNVPLTT